MLRPCRKPSSRQLSRSRVSPLNARRKMKFSTEIILVAAAIVVSAATATACPDGFTAVNDRCYSVSTETGTFDDAVDVCEAEGTQLVSLETQEEFDAVKELLSDTVAGYWTAATSDAADNVRSSYTWSDGTSTLDSMWRDNRPGDGRVNVQMETSHDFLLDDAPSYMKKGVICEMADCPTGWKRLGTRCYSVSSSATVFADAKLACINDDAKLLTLETMEEFYLVKTWVTEMNDPTMSFWTTGFYDLGGRVDLTPAEGTDFVWKDGADNHVIGAILEAMWDDNKPDGYAYAVRLYTGESYNKEYALDNAYKTYSFHYICERGLP